MEYGSCAEEVRSGQILESLWCSYYLGCIISSIPCLLCFIKNVSLILFFIRNLFCDSFGWWLLLDVISPCGLIVAQVWLWRESQRWWDVGVGFLFLWPSAIETGKTSLFHYTPVISKPQLQEKFISPSHSLLVFPGSGTFTTLIRADGSFILRTINGKIFPVPVVFHSLSLAWHLDKVPY